MIETTTTYTNYPRMIDATAAQESVKLVGLLYEWMKLEYWLLKLVIGRPLPEHPLEPWHPPELVNSVCL